MSLAAAVRGAAAFAVVVAVGAYDLWAVRAAGQRFVWGQDLGGYYNYLGRAFAGGQLHLPITPSPALLALANPYDPSVDDSLKMHDMALFHGRYYLYHGAGPAVMLFAPWRLLTGHDLPENFALFLFCFGGFLFSAAALAALRLPAGPLLVGAMLLTLGLGQGVPFLLNRVWVYEIAVAGGYFCLSAAFCFLIVGTRAGNSPRWLAASGLMFGLAVACRPHLALAGGFAFAALGWRRPRAVRPLAAFAVPFALIVAAVAAYNYARFGNPFEFGVSYLLAGPNQNRVKLSAGNLLPGLYHLFLSPPEFSAVFPWLRPVFRFPFDSERFGLPAGYVAEPTVGALYLAPVMLGIFLIPLATFGKPARQILSAIAVSSAAILVFVSSTGWSIQRYEVDFLPLAVFAGLAGAAAYIAARKGAARIFLRGLLGAAIAYGVIANLAIGFTGPYDDFLRNKPVHYLRLARWFSPIPDTRQLLNPAVDIQFTAEIPTEPGYHEPLVTLGSGAYRYYLYTEHPPGRFRIFSQSESSTVSFETEDHRGRSARFQLHYIPGTRSIQVSMDGRQILTHPIGTLVTAPEQVSIGENRIDRTTTDRRFRGRISDARALVRPSS
jgi:hypothetical protein